MKTIFLGWIHGVGKSTIIQWLMQGQKNIGHYSFWENVREIGKSSGIVHDVKEYSWLSNDVRIALMQKAKERFKEVIASEIYDILLVDNHFSVYESNQLVKAIDDEDLALYDTFVFVDVPIDILHSRIAQDSKERTTQSCDKEKILQHSIYERTVAEDLKQRYNIELIEVENIDLTRSIEKIQERI